MAEVGAPQGEWVDIYEASGIAAGTAIVVQSKSPGFVMISEGASAPVDSPLGYMLSMGEPLVISAGSSGAWAQALSSDLNLFVGAQ